MTEPPQDHPLIDWTCGCGYNHPTYAEGKRCCERGEPRPHISGVPYAIALSLVDFEDDQGRSLREQFNGPRER